MPSLFSRIRGKDGPKSKKNGNLADLANQLPNKPRWEDAYTRTTVEPEEVQELVKRCTEEVKARALDLPFLLLPFRPTSDPSAVRTFIRHFFNDENLRGDALAQELRMTEPMVISGVLKWVWSRLLGGIVGWDAYELFRVGEQDSNMARDSFSTFIPLSVENQARSHIIFDYFDLLSAISAHGKSNGFGGRKLSRMAAWWAFEHKDTGNGFDGGYKSWLSAADATSHLFFAYLRSLSPQQARAGISMLPMSLQKLLQETEYPPQAPSLLMSSTYRVVMIVDAVSSTPFALLRRANHFQYRDEDQALREFSEYEDPVKALTEECRRVLKAISLANQSQVSSSKHSTGLRDASWSRFEDIGFGGALEEEDEDSDSLKFSHARNPRGLRTTPASGANLGRPTTPSWADFLSSGFVDDAPNSPSNLLLPPDKILPPIETTVRQRSAQSHRPRLESDRQLEPGELASISRFDLDEAFWWVWMSSLAPEETAERKSAFGRCSVLETVIRQGRWLVIEEMVKGAAPEPDAGAYIAEKKGLFSWTRRNRGISRSKSTAKASSDKNDRLNPGGGAGAGLSKTSIGPDQQAKIQAAAQKLQARQLQEQQASPKVERRGRTDTEVMREKTQSILTLQPGVVNVASPAMKWASKYDKETIRAAYLGNSFAGRGVSQTSLQMPSHPPGTNGLTANGGSPKPDVQEQPQSPISVQSQPEPEPKPPVTPKPAPVTEKKLAAPQPIHPAQRSEQTGRDSPLPPTPREGKSVEAARETMLSPEPSSPDGKKHKKLHKEDKKSKSSGFKKLFGRNKNRQSKLPENAAADVNSMLAAQSLAPAPAARPPMSPESVASPDLEALVERSEEKTPTQTPVTPVRPGQGYEPSIDDNLSRVDTADAAEAHTEFSRFDQGPLLDQPAFIPDDDQSVDSAAPPPIARHSSRHPALDDDDDDDDAGAPSPSVPMQDRWAAIRKNAAERVTRPSEEQSRGAHSKTTDDGDETSGEETIESRVARIKARVAELTGNMEGASGPVTPSSRR
ncbi:Morphogenesis-related protein MSB1 [Daldinia childiae]|uniref:Morphogenesis-related protein MSB1 n=1 Tax=Daldinia childiae TaxID=326645 RepID=UPI0014489040|nr:Morphogenesis-related protein MSB1 [Daldinia childiae]KAF3057152.1 Morphogenesis-related protein MSB1 [Daldinia childiae]